MQVQTTRPEWFQTVPFTQAIDLEFDVGEYFIVGEIDEEASEDVVAILKMSAFIRIALECGASIPTPRKIAHYKESIADLSRYSFGESGEGTGLNDKIEGSDFGDFWEPLGNYKGFEIFVSIDQGNVLVSQPDGPCFETRDGWTRFSKIPHYNRPDTAIADAQEFIDSFVLARRNDDPEIDWHVLGRLQLSLPLKIASDRIAS